MSQRSTFRLLFAPVVAACFLAGCAQSPQQPAAPPDTRATDEATIRAADMDWVKSAEAKDLEKCMSVYADDAVGFAPGMPAFVGKDNIRKFIQGLLGAPGLHLEFHIASVTVARSGDIAIDRGTVNSSVTGKNGKPASNTSEYVLVWKKQADSSWKIIADTSANQKAPQRQIAKKSKHAKRKH